MKVALAWLTRAITAIVQNLHQTQRTCASEMSRSQLRDAPRVGRKERCTKQVSPVQNLLQK